MEQLGLIGLFGLCTYDDIKTKTVRVIEIVIFAMLGLFFNGVNQKQDIFSIVGGVSVGLVFYFIAVITEEKIGKGDALIIMVAGIYLGFAQTLELVWISSVLSGLAGLYFLFMKKEMKTFEMPFVPFLLAGYVLMYVGNQMIGVVA